jgi:hypothetical protein
MVEASVKCKPLVFELVLQNHNEISDFRRHDGPTELPREISTNGMRIVKVSVIVDGIWHCLTPRRVVDEFDFSWHETVA